MSELRQVSAQSGVSLQGISCCPVLGILGVTREGRVRVCWRGHMLGGVFVMVVCQVVCHPFRQHIMTFRLGEFELRKDASHF
jgi:hypothetical protein